MHAIIQLCHMPAVWSAVCGTTQAFALVDSLNGSACGHPACRYMSLCGWHMDGVGGVSQGGPTGGLGLPVGVSGGWWWLWCGVLVGELGRLLGPPTDWASVSPRLQEPIDVDGNGTADYYVLVRACLRVGG